MWTSHYEAPSRKKNHNFWKLAELSQFLYSLQTYREFLKIIFFERKITVTTSFFKILRSSFLQTSPICKRPFLWELQRLFADCIKTNFSDYLKTNLRQIHNNIRLLKSTSRPLQNYLPTNLIITFIGSLPPHLADNLKRHCREF